LKLLGGGAERHLTPGPSPISHPGPRRERGDKKKQQQLSFVFASLLFSPLPGLGGWEMGEGPGVRCFFSALLI